MLSKKTILGVALLATACTTYHNDRTSGDRPGFDPYDNSSAAGTCCGGAAPMASQSSTNNAAMIDYDNTSTDGWPKNSDVKARESSYAVPGDAHPLSAQDREFIADAMSGGMFEVESARLALDNFESDEQLDMARMLLDDHTKANRELEAIATRNGVTPSHGLGTNQAMLESLRSSEGPAFGARYQEQQLKAHREAIKLFEDEARDGTNADLKNFAARTLPTLRKHLDMLGKPHVERAMNERDDTSAGASDTGG